MEKSPFWQDNALFTSKAKINVFWKNFERSGPEGHQEWRFFFQKTLILAFEVIIQPPKHTFEIRIFFSRFSSLCETRRKFVAINDNKIHITPTILHLYILKVHAENMPLLFFWSSALALLDLEQLCIMKYWGRSFRFLAGINTILHYFLVLGRTQKFVIL